jgi:uncharacterized membrane protein YbhN (UPF0104 family)
VTAPTRSALLWILKITVSGTLLYVLLSQVDLARLGAIARSASPIWLLTALGLYLAMILISAWRWDLLLRAQRVEVPFAALTNSFLVATFFNNFLPSNIGGDVVRIGDTARPARSKTLATMVVLVDRGVGLVGLIFVAAVGASVAAWLTEAIGPLGPGLLWIALGAVLAVAVPVLLLPQGVGLMLRPLRVIHQEWVELRIQRLVEGLGRFRERPRAILGCFGGAILVQAVLVGFYAAVAHAIGVRIAVSHLAILVPISFVVQMVPLSVNGLGVREWVFGTYFTRLGLPLESALALSFIGAALIMLFSTSGAIVYLSRRRFAETHLT